MKQNDAETSATHRGKYETRLPPLSIDRYMRVSLSEQVADGLRRAILDGFYKPGDVLPPLGALTSQLDVSLRVARDAIQRLSRENLVMVRPRVGCRVLHQNAKCRHGRVLAVAGVENMTSYYHSVLLLELGRLMTQAGYLFELVPLFKSKSGRVDFAPLTDKLRSPINIVMGYHPPASVSRRLTGLAVPYVAVGSSSKMRCTTYVRGDGTNARKIFVDACVRRDVRRALVAVYGCRHSLGDELELKGVDVERIVIPVKFGLKVGERLERESMEAVASRLVEMREDNRPPDVICAGDDFITRGALAACEHLGMRIPEDVEFVGSVNDGAAPAMPLSMACFRHDPVATAKTVAKTLLGHLRGNRVPHDVFFKTEFAFGDTFRE